VEALLAYAQAASAEQSKGIVELDNASAEIRKLLGMGKTRNRKTKKIILTTIGFIGTFDHSFKGNPQATPEDIVNAAKQVAEATALLVAACNNSPVFPPLSPFPPECFYGFLSNFLL
jgi:hypothetical protein